MKYVGRLLLLAAFSGPVYCQGPDVDEGSKMAAQSTSDTPPRLESDLIDGLILNRAMTRVGHRFYREFVAAYRDIGGMTEHGGLSIVELATARSGSKISVLHNRKPIFVTVVSPAGRQLDKLAEQVARRVDSILKQNKKQASWAQWLDPDLAPDEF
ncbi:curli production assembly/transport protein CsgE [Shewanella aquimarina]|uniref:curli production assembly/transport protein CsgE n=1 Tax=Shewanella aquimarina TaxID=260365 RepID=UPI002014EDDA|nr:curli production assembly/transport protein CsgE [Shewanella aquimarina]